MTELVELTSEQHKNLQVSERSALIRAANMHVIHLRAQEVPQVICDFPVFFSRADQSREWSLSALCSFVPGQNPFVGENQWYAGYQPISLRTYPFYLMRADGSEKGYTFGIDEEAQGFVEEGGRALFDANGRPTQYLNETTKMLEATIQQDRQTYQFCQMLDGLGLMRSVDLIVQNANGQAQTIQGLQTIDEDKLSSLNSAQLDELNRNGYLVAIHAMLISLYQLNALVRRHNQSNMAETIVGVRVEVARDRTAA